MLIGVYKVFIGVLLAAFVGVGIVAFAPEPRFPEYPPFFPQGPAAEASPEARQQREEFQTYRMETATYSRNVSAVSAAAAILLMVASLTLLRRTPLFSDGFLLGGLLTFAYSIARGSGAEDNLFRFIIIALGLGIALALGYTRFVRQNPPTQTSQ